VATGAKSIIVPKSGCKATKKTTAESTNKNGKNQLSNVCKTFLYFLKKYERYIIKPNFKNSVGCIVKGIHGIDIHHLAHFNVIHISKTTISNDKVQKNIYLACFSKNVYGIFTKIHRIIIEITT
jgi:hypothetical protein